MKNTKIYFIKSLLKYRELLWRLTKRAVASRYKGSVLGFGWSLLQPLVMLSVYTLVFSTIFKSRWPGLENAGSIGYAINLFAGLILFNLFAECIGASPTLIVSNKNYVTKVIFPLEILSAANVGAAVFQTVTNNFILAIFEVIAFGRLPITFLWIPLVLIPPILSCLALSWLISAASVYLRDIEQLVPMTLSIIMFLSAIFYPINSLPEYLRSLMRLNPVAISIEQIRRVAIEGLPPTLIFIIAGVPLALLVCEISYRTFKYFSRGFADVL